MAVSVEEVGVEVEAVADGLLGDVVAPGDDTRGIGIGVLVIDVEDYLAARQTPRDGVAAAVAVAHDASHEAVAGDVGIYEAVGDGIAAHAVVAAAHDACRMALAADGAADVQIPDVGSADGAEGSRDVVAAELAGDGVAHAIEGATEGMGLATHHRGHADVGHQLGVDIGDIGLKIVVEHLPLERGVDLDGALFGKQVGHIGDVGIVAGGVNGVVGPCLEPGVQCRWQHVEASTPVGHEVGFAGCPSAEGRHAVVIDVAHAGQSAEHPLCISYFEWQHECLQTGAMAEESVDPGAVADVEFFELKTLERRATGEHA